MKLSQAQRLAITTTIGSQVEARPNTLASLVRLGLAERRTERGRLTGRAMARHYLTEAGRTVRNDIRTAEQAEREQRGDVPAPWATRGVRISTPVGNGTVTGRSYSPADDSRYVVFRLDGRAEGDENMIAAISPHLHRLCTRCDTVGDDSLPARGTLCGYCAAQDAATEPEQADPPRRPTPGTSQPGQADQEQQHPASLPVQPTNRRNPAMTDDRDTERTGNAKPIAPEAIRLAAEVKHMTDSDADVDYSALAKLDEMPEDEAVGLLDETMRGLLFD